MKKTLLFVSALFAFMLCDAQVKTHSNYDVDGDGSVTVADVTKTVNRVTEKLSDDRTVVDGESLNATLQEILSKLKSLDERIANLEKKSCTCNCSVDASDPYNGHEYVDLGLPSGLKWATCNVGANNPEEFGDYFAWGETEPYYTEGHSQDSPCSNWKTGKTAGYDWPSYKWCNGSSTTLTKYCISSSDGTVDNKTVLDPADDAAHVNWGGSWRMPTKAELEELRTKCTWTWGSQNGVKGYTIVGPNGNSLFLPAAGWRHRSGLDDVGSDGGFWTSSLGSNGPCCIGFYMVYAGTNYFNRYCGHTVRPVCP